ncbi:MAG: anti-sigma factor domain-containing protein [Janthinobacterium lividum]
MNVSKHIPEDDLALFALALMQPEEAAFALAHLKHCDVCRDELARLQGSLVVYAMTADSEAPPSAARERLLRAVALEEKKFFPQPQASPEPVSLPRSRHLEPLSHDDEPVPRDRRFITWSGWAIAAALTAFAGWQAFQMEDLRKALSTETAAISHIEQSPNSDVAHAQEILRTLTDPTGLQVSLHVPTSKSAPVRPEGHAAYNAESGDLIFVGSHLKTLREDKTYELWLLPASGEKPLPAGLFKPDANGNASILLPHLPDHVAAKGFGVTVEDDGGSSKPTTPLVLVGS